MCTHSPTSFSGYEPFFRRRGRVGTEIRPLPSAELDQRCCSARALPIAVRIGGVAAATAPFMANVNLMEPAELANFKSSFVSESRGRALNREWPERFCMRKSACAKPRRKAAEYDQHRDRAQPLIKAPTSTVMGCKSGVFEGRICDANASGPLPAGGPYLKAEIFPLSSST